MKKIILFLFALTIFNSNAQDIEIEEVPFSIIEQVPVYPGCESYDMLQHKNCMSNQIRKHIVRKFNIDLANSLSLSAGKKRIHVQFTIDKKGVVTNIKAKAPHSTLEQEAIRVIELLPKMKPGTQKGKSVNVRYNLPITFMVEDVLPVVETKKERRKRLKKERKLRKSKK